MVLGISGETFNTYGLHVLINVMVDRKLVETIEYLDLSAQDPFREEHMISIPQFGPKIKSFPKLLYLDLSVNHLAAEGTKVLFSYARQGMFPSLQFLNLERNSIPDEGLEEIFLPPSLIKLKSRLLNQKK